MTSPQTRRRGRIATELHSIGHLARPWQAASTIVEDKRGNVDRGGALYLGGFSARLVGDTARDAADKWLARDSDLALPESAELRRVVEQRFGDKLALAEVG